MTTLMFFAGPDGRAHPYAVSGVVGKHLSPEALELNRNLQRLAAGGDPAKARVLGETTPLGKEWQDAIALLDGPLRNVATVPT